MRVAAHDIARPGGACIRDGQVQGGSLQLLRIVNELQVGEFGFQTFDDLNRVIGAPAIGNNQRHVTELGISSHQ